MRRLLGNVLAVVCLVPGMAFSASVDGIPLKWAMVGEGDPVIFVHGWTCDSSSWAGQVPFFAKEYRVITLDLPGHGKSGAPGDGKFSMELFARAVEAVRQEAKVDKVVLIGHSMGAAVIGKYAEKYPQHVTALIGVDGYLDVRGISRKALADVPPSMVGPEGSKAREKAIRSMFTERTPDALQKRILAMMLSAPEATAQGAMQAMLDHIKEVPKTIGVPALGVYAGTFQVPDEEVMEKGLTRYEASQMPGTGHFLMMEKPEEFNWVALAFVDKAFNR